MESFDSMILQAAAVDQMSSYADTAATATLLQQQVSSIASMTLPTSRPSHVDDIHGFCQTVPNVEDASSFHDPVHFPEELTLTGESQDFFFPGNLPFRPKVKMATGYSRVSNCYS